MKKLLIGLCLYGAVVSVVSAAEKAKEKISMVTTTLLATNEHELGDKQGLSYVFENRFDGKLHVGIVINDSSSFPFYKAQSSRVSFNVDNKIYILEVEDIMPYQALDKDAMEAAKELGIDDLFRGVVIWLTPLQRHHSRDIYRADVFNIRLRHVDNEVTTAVFSGDEFEKIREVIFPNRRLKNPPKEKDTLPPLRQPRYIRKKD